MSSIPDTRANPGVAAAAGERAAVLDDTLGVSMGRPVAARRFRRRLFFAIAAVVAISTAIGLFVADRYVMAAAEREAEAGFQVEFHRARALREYRIKELERRCAALVSGSRIHAALEDDALDLLYPSSREELADLLAPAHREGPGLQANFYRFLDHRGAVIPPPDGYAGKLTATEAAALVLPAAPATTQLGYLFRPGVGYDSIVEYIATPILSTTTRKPIAALVVGFDPTPARSGDDERLFFVQGVEVRGDHVSAGTTGALRALLARRVAEPSDEISRLELDGQTYLVLAQRLNPGSTYAPAYEVAARRLEPMLAVLHWLRWRILAGGVLVLVGAMLTSHWLSGRFARPVARLADESHRRAIQVVKAQAELATTQADLQRAARFSANASHQLKTPVAVMRAGLDLLLARDDLAPEVREELGALVRETGRFKAMIDDLLLLSRMDAGRLQIQFQPVDLSHLIASAIDDLSVLADPFELAVTMDVPEGLLIRGERRYVGHILHNLLENALRYNRANGRIVVRSQVGGGEVRVLVGNTGRTVPPEIQPQLFERFHRGSSGEDVPGHGLGLNIARELARLHGGDLRLERSADDWTEFAIVFPVFTGEAPADTARL